MRKVLAVLVERGMTGVDSGVEVAHAILHAERYHERYYKVGRGREGGKGGREGYMLVFADVS